MAKHRGKNRRSKREFADSPSGAAKSIAPPATASIAPGTDDRDETEESASEVSTGAVPTEASAPARESSGTSASPAPSASAAEPPKDASPGGTVIQFPRSARGADESAEKKDEGKSAPSGAGLNLSKSGEAYEKKADEKKADEKKAAEKKADEKKADEKKAEEKGDGKRARKVSLGDLGEDARAFFSDRSFDASQKVDHDRFDDLKPEDHPPPNNGRLMLATVAFVASIVLVVGGLALHRHFWGVAETTLPPAPSHLTQASDSHGSESTGGGTHSGAAMATEETDAGATVAANEGSDAGATVAASEGTDAGATVAANEGTDAGATVAASEGTDAGAAAAPSGPAELLVAAQRAQGRGAGAAAAAYQAYLDAGGNDGAALARFAFWLANRNDLGRAGEWAERATQLDPNNQLGWYVLGAAKMEGPRRDAAAARAAFRRCAQLPGRYATDCRAGL